MCSCEHASHLLSTNDVREAAKAVRTGLERGDLHCLHIDQCEVSLELEGGAHLLWACLACGLCGCGRHAPGQKHAKAHWKEHGGNHGIVINLATSMLWCYSCDAEVLDKVSGNDERSVSGALRGLIFPPREPSSEEEVDHDGTGDAAESTHSRDFEETAFDSLAVDASAVLCPAYTTTAMKAASRDPPVLLGVCGLSNLGNTCFMNSVLQALNACAVLVEYIQYSFPVLTAAAAAASPNSRAPVLIPRQQQTGDALYSLFRTTWSGQRTRISPGRCLTALSDANMMFRGYGQHDAHEALICILDRLRDEISLTQGSLLGSTTDNIVQTSRTIVDVVFGGLVRSKVKCLYCEKVSITDSSFFHLSCPIPQTQSELDDLRLLRSDRVPDEGAPAAAGGLFSGIGRLFGFGGGASGITLDDCLQKFVAPERLEFTEQYHCENCNELRDAEKQLSILSSAPSSRDASLGGDTNIAAEGSSHSPCLPAVLLIHLKRFRHNTGYWGSSKVSDPVTFPLRGWDIAPYCSFLRPASTLYDLTAVICHFGSMSGGHYVTFAYNYMLLKWFEFDDGQTREVAEETVESVGAASGYILQYTRRSGSQKLQMQLQESISSWTAEHAQDQDDDIVYMSEVAWASIVSETSTPGNRNEEVSPGEVAFDPVTCPHGKLRPSRESALASVTESLEQPQGPSPLLRDGKGLVRIPRELIMAQQPIPCWQFVISEVKRRGVPLLSPQDVHDTACATCVGAARILQLRRSEERSRISELDTKTVGDSEKWYLMPAVWLARWNEFVQGQSDPPGEIDMTLLVTQSDEVGASWQPRKGLKSVKHYRGVCRSVFKYFQEAYGLRGPAIVRDVIDLYAPEEEDST